MKMWNEVHVKGMPFEMVKRTIKGVTCYYTRPEWEGVHFWSSYHRWCILLKDGTLMKNVTLSKIEAKDKSDWMAVSITDDAVKLIIQQFNPANA